MSATSANSVVIGTLSDATGTSALAIGQQASSTGTTSVAIGGVSAKASGRESIALGSYVEASADGSTALGQAVIRNADGERLDTTSTGGIRTATAASGQYSVAVGSGVKAQALDSIAMGTLAVASKEAIGGIAIGLESKVNAVNATAIGTEAEATGLKSTALGQKASATGMSAMALGQSSSAGYDYATAIGSEAKAYTDSVAIGREVEAGGSQSLAIGSSIPVYNAAGVEISRTKTVASGGGAIALGAGVIATSANSIVVGTESKASGSSAIAIGREAESIETSSVAIGGVAAKASGHESIALGSYVEATGEGSTSLGQAIILSDKTGERLTSTLDKNGAVIGTRKATTNTGEYSVAIGSGVTVAGLDAIAIGTEAFNNSSGGVAIGHDSNAAGSDTVALGAFSKVSGANTVAIGTGAEAHIDGALAFGTLAFAKQGGALAIGMSSSAVAMSSTALGDSAEATEASSLALGAGAKANHENSVALGAGSETGDVKGQKTLTLDGEKYTFAGAGEGVTSTVSVGSKDNERTISNVAAGLLADDSTEAVNGSQLFATNTAVDRLGDQAVRYDVDKAEDGTETVNYNRITLDGDTYNPADQTGGTTIANVADGKQDSDAVNLSQLKAGTKYFNANSEGDDSDAAGLDSVAIGMGAIARNEGDVALGANSVTGDVKGQDKLLLDGKEYEFAGAGEGVTSTVSVGSKDNERTISNVAAGLLADDSTEAVNGSQLFATNTAVDRLGDQAVRYSVDKAEDGTETVNYNRITLDGDTYNPADQTGGTTIANVADGKQDSDAVNLSQLKAGTKYFNANSEGDDSDAAGLDSVAIGMGAIARNEGDVALGANSVTGDVKGQDKLLLDGKEYEFAGAGEGVTSTVSVGKDGAERTISNVAAGLLSAESTEAVNGSQLFATNTAVDRLGNQAVRYDVREDGTVNYGSITLGREAYDPETETGGTRLSNVADGKQGTDAVNLSQLEKVANSELTFQSNDGKVAKTLGSTVDILGAGSTEGDYSGANLKTAVVDDKLQLLMADNPDFTTVNVGENKTTVLTGDGLTITDGPKFTKTEVDVAGNKIVNVAEGEVKDGSTDAVNGSQLYNRTKYFKANSTGDEADAVGLDSVAIGMGAIAHNANDVALGADSVTAKAKGQNDVKINGKPYEFAGKNATSTVSVGDVGSERTISNVAAGLLSAESTEAVNGSQLYATNTALEGLNNSVGELTDSPLTFAANQGENAKRKLGETMRILGGGATGEGETYSAGNVLTELDEKGDLTIKLADNAAFESVTTGKTVMNTDGLTIENGPMFTKEKVDVAGNKIVNVAEGVDDTDAVNVGQLNNKVKYFKANSKGTEALALGDDAVAIGMGAIANNANDVALGANSVTKAAVGTAGESINGTDYAFAGANPTSTVSVGSEGKERTITNVAAGRLSETSTDAVNGSQLFATNTALENLDNSVGGLQKDALLWDADKGAFSASHGDTTVNKITNVAAGDLGEKSTDAVNGSQLFATNQNVETNTTNIAKNTQNISDLGDSVENIYNTGTKYFHANSTGADSTATGLDSVAIGMGAIANNANDVALGANSVTKAAVGTAGESINGTNYAFAGANPTSTVSVGDVGSERTITNVAAGRLSETSTDAVNGSQLFATNTALENLDNSVGGLQKDALLWDADKGAFSASHGDTTVNKITNVAAGDLGEKSTDAVNGSQLFATNQNVETNTTNIAKNTQNISDLGDSVENIYNTGTKYFHANSTGADSTATGLDSVAIGMGAIANNANDVALGANSVTKAAVGTAGESINGTNYAFAGANPTSTVSVGDVGSERTITNVAAGRLSETSTDAVNGSQLFATNTALENLDNSVGGLQKDALLWDADKGAFSASHGDTTVNKITNVEAGDLGEKSTDAVNGSQLFATNQNVETNTTNIAKNTQNISDLGDSVENIYNTGTKYFHANSTGADSQALGQDSVAIGMGAIANNANDVALGANSVTKAAVGTAGASINGTDYAFAGANPASTVSVGDVGSERTITNVAAGRLSETSTDAVNGSQLYATNSAVENLNNNVGGLQKDALLWDADKGAFSASHGDTTVNKITNVAEGALEDGSTDAVNGSQLKATNDQVATNTTNIAQNTQNITNLGDTVTTINEKGTRYFHANSTGADSQALGQDAVAIGMGAVAKNAGDIALGAGSLTEAAVGTAGVTLRGTDYAFAGANPTSTVSVGSAGAERTITNVAAGRLSETSTDAVNGSQLYATNSAVENLNNNVGGLQKDALLWDADKGAFSASHGDTTVNKITNVAAGDLGEKSTDAVNGSQLFATNQNVETNTTNIAKNTQNISNLGDTITTINEKGTKYFHANSTGADSQALGLDSVAIGMGAVANNAGDIALGAGSLTEAAVGTAGVTLRGTDYAFAGANPTSTVSVGSAGAERTITNVAAGRLSETSTDAVNGSQLYATNSAVENLHTSVGGLEQDALQWDADKGAFSASHGDTVVNNITNVAAGELGEKSTDAVNGSQLFTTNQNVETNTTNIAKNTQNISNLGDSVQNIYTSGTKYFHANSTGADSQALGLDSVAIGMGAVANNAGDIALGAGSLTEAAVGTAGVTLRGTDYAFAGANPTSTVSVGSEGAERTITNVAAGRLSETSTDAVNGSQLYATNTAVENLNIDVDGLQKDALLWDEYVGSFSASHGDTAVNKITNVAAGELSEKSTDAVNGSQLFATNQQVATNTTNIAKNTQNISNLGDSVQNIYNTGIKYFHANSTGADSQALGLDSVAIGMGAVANNAGDIALGAGSLTEAAVGTAGVTLRGTDYAFAGANPTSTLSVGSEGAERTITNVAAGRLSATSTDAVNGSQLYATNTALENIVVNVDGLKGDALLWDENLGAFSASHGSTTVNKITNVAAGELSAKSTDAVNGSQLYATNQKVENLDYRVTNIEESYNNTVMPTMRYLKVNSTGPDAVASGKDAVALGQGTVASGDNSIATGNGAQASGNGAIATGNNASASGTGSVAIGDNASVTASNSVALGSGSVADRDNTVSVGSAGNERQVTNVAAGTEDTDAVNVAQLKDATGSITNNVSNISNGKDGMFQVNNTSNYAKPAVSGSDSLAGGAGSSASGSNSMAVGTKASASGANSVALGNGSSATAKNSVALGANSVANRENSVSMGYSGGERQVTNVAAGTEITDAVNVGQLKQGVSESVNYTNKQFNQLKNMVNDQKDKLSAGIAGAMAMSSLPQPYAPGASMVGLGGGTYQGQSAVALGVSTISDNGKWVTKISGTTNSQGDFGASIGVGYQW
nr:YadA-like family protein [Klebsiella oxytoca]